MNGQERVRTALAHRRGKVPVDFGSTAVTGMHVSVVAQLRDHYGLERRPVKVCEPYQMLGQIEDDLADALGIDTVGIAPRHNLFGFANEGWHGFRAPWGQELLVPAGFRTRPAPGGGLHIFPGGDVAAPPSGHMPEGGFFFDTLIRQEELDEDNLKPEDNLEEFGPLAEADIQHFRREVERVRSGGRAVVATFGGTAFGDIALVPAPFLKHPRGVRDIARWYMTTALHPEFVHAVFERQSEIALGNLARIHEAVGNAVDVVFICGTDFGTQSGSFCSPATFDELYAPYYRRVNAWIHAHTTWKTFKHSCGAVENFMSHFIDSGFDIINPVQCSAAGMSPGGLKERYGDRLTFWGGGVDTQHTLPFGSPAQVREEVRGRCEIFSAHGGFVFDAIHNVQARTPVANIVAMVEAVKEFNAEQG
jgi:hypothetical protein